MKFTILEDLSLVIITMYSVFSDLCPKVKKKIFKEIHVFNPKFSPLGMGEGGHEIYNFSSPYLTDATN